MNCSPCKDCDKQGCGAYHSQCAKYLAYKEECKKIGRERYMQAKNFHTLKKRVPQEKRLKIAREEKIYKAIEERRKCGGI